MKKEENITAQEDKTETILLLQFQYFIVDNYNTVKMYVVNTGQREKLSELRVSVIVRKKENCFACMFT